MTITVFSFCLKKIYQQILNKLCLNHSIINSITTCLQLNHFILNTEKKCGVGVLKTLRVFINGIIFKLVSVTYR